MNSNKKLFDMTLEELWQLFPIELTEHRSEWAQWYYDENVFIQGLFIDEIRLSHIGSTAISTIWAKPIIDILMEIPREKGFLLVQNILCDNGYIIMSRDENRMSFNKGYTDSGFCEKVFHLHLRYLGDNDEIYFRDYLIKHPQIAKEYETLKLSLWKKHKYNREAYTLEKTDFINHYTNKAKKSQT